MNINSLGIATSLYIGENQKNKLIGLIRKYDYILIVTGRESSIKNGSLDFVINSIISLRIGYKIINGITNNFDYERANEIVNENKNIDLSQKNLILSVGGSTVLDFAKILALSFSNLSLNILRLIDSNNSFDTLMSPMDIASLVTNLGTGSELNGVAVLYSPKHSLKMSISDLRLRPKFVISDSTFISSIDVYNLSNNIIDVISHYLEQFFSDNLSISVLDKLLLESLAMIFELFDKYMTEQNKEILDQLSFISMHSLSFFFTYGNGSIWLLHNIEYAISGVFNVRHSSGISCLLQSWLKHISLEKEYSHRFDYLNEFMISKGFFYSGLTIIEFIDEWQKLNFLPRNLNDVNLNESHIPLIIDSFKRNNVYISRKNIKIDSVKEILEFSLNIY